MNNKETSWGKVANWYDSYLGAEDNYQAKVIWPNLERLLGTLPKGGEAPKGNLLDVACGQGYFSFLANKYGYSVTGTDIADELIHVANRRIEAETAIKSGKPVPQPEFFVAPSNSMPMLKDNTYDIAICILALQNIKELDQTFKEVSRLLKSKGRFIFVLNHPSFRVPQSSDWYFDQKKGVQSRLVSKYMQETSIKIDMNPGIKNPRQKIYTTSFHRPLQLFIKFLSKNGFAVSRLEEWCSHKKTEAGPRKAAEDIARKEIPMFIAIEAISDLI